MSEFYSLAKKALPQKLKRAISFFLENRNIDLLIKIKICQLNQAKIKLFFSGQEKKKGYISLGFEQPEEAVLGDLQHYFKDNSVDEIYLDNFVHHLGSHDEIVFFFNQCLRVLKPRHKMIIKFIDADIVFKKYLEEKKCFRQEKYWSIKKRYLFNNELDVVNSILFDDPKIKKLLNVKNLTNFLLHSNFSILETKKNLNELSSIIVARKKGEKELFSKLAIKLSTRDKIKNDLPLYLYNCDSLWMLRCFRHIELNKLINRHFASVIGSLSFINLIPYLKPKSLYLFDVNQYQVRYMKLFVEILRISNSFEDLLENLLVRKFRRNTEAFLQSEFSHDIYKKVSKISTDKEIFAASIGKIAQGKYVKLEDSIPALKIADNSMCQHLTILKEELFRPGPEVNVIYTQEGLADHFEEIKKVLLAAKIKKARLESSEVYEVIKEKGIIYVSNIGEEDWLYDVSTAQDVQSLKRQAREENLTAAFAKQWLDGYYGFHHFLRKIAHNFWLIDSVGNIFNSQDLLKHKSDSHQWLWQKIKPLVRGKTIELIHQEDGKWGFSEHLETKNVKEYIKRYKSQPFDTIVFHLLLANGVSLATFLAALKIAARNSKRIIILEHDRDSLNFGPYSRRGVVDIRSLLNIIRSVEEVNRASLSVSWSGASLATDERIYGERANFNRNFIVTVDL